MNTELTTEMLMDRGLETAVRVAIETLRRNHASDALHDITRDTLKIALVAVCNRLGKSLGGKLIMEIVDNPARYFAFGQEFIEAGFQSATAALRSEGLTR